MAKDPLSLLQEFASIVVSAETVLQPEYSIVVQNLCEKAPAIAQFLAEELLKYLKGSEEEYENQGQEAKTPLARSRRRRPIDSSYRPPRPAGTRKGCSEEIAAQDTTASGDRTPNGEAKRGSASSEVAAQAPDGGFHNHDMPFLAILTDNSSSVLVPPTSLSDVETRSNSPALVLGTPLSETNPPENSSPALVPGDIEPAVHFSTNTGAAKIDKEIPVQGSSIAVSKLAHANGDIETVAPLNQHTTTPPTPSRQEQEPATPPNPRQQQIRQDVTRSTPGIQTGRLGQQSPQTEEVPRMNLSALRGLELESHSSSPLLETLNFRDFLGEMIDVIAAMNKPQDREPKGVHSAILRSLQANLNPKSEETGWGQPGSIWTTTDSNTWSSHMWNDFLEADEGRSQKTTVLNMIGYMGVSSWFDAQLAQFDAPLTKRGKPRKRVASPFLTSLLKERDNQGGARKRRKIESVGTGLSTSHSTSISEDIIPRKRRTITEKIFKGRKLLTMVSKAGLGILLRREIWDYQKMRVHDFERRVAEEFQADPRKQVLLPILDEQVHMLVDEGRTNLSHFFASLESHNILSWEEMSKLRAKFNLAPVSKKSLNAEVDHLAGLLRQLPHKPDKEQTVMVGDAVELPLKSLDRLRPGLWLDLWLIAAAMELADKPSWVRYSLSIPLDEDERGKAVPHTKPFSRWKRKIDGYRSEANSNVRQIYFCPVNTNINHFTLLEINEQLRMIYHYDSMASHNVIHDKAGPTRVRDIVEAEFGDLGFGYKEAPCPQTKDESCGLMVIHNFLLRITGFEVGDWDDTVDSEQVRKNLVDLLQMALQSNSLQPKVAWLADSQSLTHPTDTPTAEPQTSNLENRATYNPATGNCHEETVDLTADDDHNDKKPLSKRQEWENLCIIVHSLKLKVKDEVKCFEWNGLLRLWESVDTVWESVDFDSVVEVVVGPCVNYSIQLAIERIEHTFGGPYGEDGTGWLQVGLREMKEMLQEPSGRDYLGLISI